MNQQSFILLAMSEAIEYDLNIFLPDEYVYPVDDSEGDEISQRLVSEFVGRGHEAKIYS